MSENEKPLTYASVCVCVCVCGLCISVYTQTYVAVVYFAHIYALQRLTFIIVCADC